MTATHPLPYRVGAVFLLREDGAALMQHRDDKPGLPRAGMWVAPGGHCEADESDAACAAREFTEETDYRCHNLRRLKSTVDENDVTGEKYELVIYWDRFDGVQQPRCLEGQDLRFLPRQQAEEYGIPSCLIEAWDEAIAAAGLVLALPNGELEIECSPPSLRGS